MFVGTKRAIDLMPAKARRRTFQNMEAPYGLTGVNAGEVEPVHEQTLTNVHEQQLVEVNGQSDVLVHGGALPRPLQRQLDDEPDPGHLPRTRLLLQHVPRTSRSSARAAW